MPAPQPCTSIEAPVLENGSRDRSGTVLFAPGGGAPAPTRIAPQSALARLNGLRQVTGKPGAGVLYSGSSSETDPLPAGSMTIMPFPVAYAIAAKSSGHHSSGRKPAEPTPVAAGPG